MLDQKLLSEELCQELAGIMKLPSIGPEDDLLDLGIDSLSALRFFEILNQKLNREISIASLFEYPSVKELLEMAAADTES